MILDNKNKITRIKQTGLLYTVVFGVVVLVLLYLKKDPFTQLGITKKTITIVLSALYTYFVIARYIKDYNYFLFQDLENKILFRYYSLRPFSRSKKSIEMEKAKFAGFKIEYSTMKLKRHLILYQNSANGLKQFPKISVSAVSRKNLGTLSKILGGYIQK